MRESGYYPPGAEFDASAPYNEVDPPKMELDCEVILSVSRVATVTTQDTYYDDEDGGICYDKENGDLHADYNNCYATITECMDELVKYIDKELEGKVDYNRKWILQRLRDSAVGWQIDDEEYQTY